MRWDNCELIKITANTKKRRWWVCLWIPRRRIMEVAQIILRELHRKHDESLHRIKYRINLSNHKQSFKEKVLFGNKHNVPTSVKLTTRATIVTKQLALCKLDIRVNTAYFCMAYSYTLKEEARSSETPTRRTKLHGVTHQNTVIFT
jgi:hypothetical protein